MEDSVAQQRGLVTLKGLVTLSGHSFLLQLLGRRNTQCREGKY